MRLTDEEQAMRTGAFGPVRQWAIEHQVKVGTYFGAEDFVPVTQAHIMADTESLGVAGVEWLEAWGKFPAEQRRVRVPTITDPRGTDFAAAHKLKHQPWMLDLEKRAIAAFEALGVLMTDTCINYQTIMAPVLREHCAYGDTGVTIYDRDGKLIEKIALPLAPTGPAPKQGIRDQLQNPLWEKHGIEIPIVHWHGERLIRVSCHLYNTSEHIDLLCDALVSIGIGHR